MKSILLLPKPPSVNGLFATGRHGKRYRSQKYEDWIHAAGVEIMRQRPNKIAGQVSLLYEFAEPKDKRKHDLGNLEKATTDLLVAHGIIQADDNSIVREIRLMWADDIAGVLITVSALVRSENAEAA